jgi:hypothetical protein
MTAFVERLSSQLHLQIPWRLREIHETLRRDLHRSNLVVHVAVQPLAPAIGGTKILDFHHLGFTACDR